jgi:hypothetical protein
MSQYYAHRRALYVRTHRRWYMPWLTAALGLFAVAAGGGAVGAVLFRPEAPRPAGEESSRAAGDVSLTKCDVDPQTGWPRATLRITNHGGDRASYVVSVAFQSKDATTQYGSAPTSVADLAPGQKATATAEGLDAAPRTFSCAVASIVRQ